jgi:hypothetical protein
VGALLLPLNESVHLTVPSALELVTKFCDPDFARRARVTDFRSRAWDALRASGAGSGDKVLDAILVLFAALALQTSHEVTELIQKADFVPVLWDVLATLSGADPLELLGNGASDGELKKAGIGKAEKPTVSAIPYSSSFSLVSHCNLLVDNFEIRHCQQVGTCRRRRLFDTP